MEINFVHPFFSAIFCSIWNSQAAIEDAPMYLTFPDRTTSCRARMISSIGTSRSNLWIWRTSMYVPNLSTLASTASKMCLRDRPVLFTHCGSRGSFATIPDGDGAFCKLSLEYGRVKRGWGVPHHPSQSSTLTR